jgi:hypothetical protein
MMKSSRSYIATAHDYDINAGVPTTNSECGTTDSLNVHEEDSPWVIVAIQQRERSPCYSTRAFTAPVEDRKGQVIAGRGGNRGGNLKTVVHHIAPENMEPNPSTQTPICKVQTRQRGIRPFAGNEGRYAAVEGGVRRLWIRDQVTLQADIVALLRSDGHMPKKRIITGLGAALAAIDTGLTTLRDAQLIECYKARSRRGRIDEHWCLFGESPARPTAFKFSAAATLAAMQMHATQLYGAMK